MRIAHVLRRISFDDWGGTEQVVWNIAKAQKAAGHDVRLFTTTALWRGKDDLQDKLGWRNGRLEIIDGIEIFRLKPIYPWWPMPKSIVAELDSKGGNPFVPGLGKAIREWHPDVIHCHAMARIAELCFRTARKIGVKCAISLHGGGVNVPTVEAESLKAPTRGRLPWGKMIDCAMGWTRRVPEDADGIVCVGEDEFEHYSLRHKHVLRLPCGVDLSLFKDAGHPRIHGGSVEHPSRKQTIILCVARIDRQKNQMMLVEWLARHPDSAIRLVGPVTQPDYRAELERRAAELGVSDKIVFTGSLKPASDELLAEYRNADILVLPSRHEPFGTVVLEAWAVGLPVVASNVGGLGRNCAAHPGAAILFPSGDAAALDAAVSAALEKTQEMSVAGLAAAAEYDWRTLSSRLVDFYAEI